MPALIRGGRIRRSRFVRPLLLALGLQLAAPFLVFGFAVNAAMGLLARLMPQMQIFFIAMPVNILAGFLLLVLLIGSMMTLFLSYYGTQMGSFG